MKKLASFILAAAALTLAAPASAQFSKPEDAIKYRKNSFFVMQQHFARVGAMVSGKVPFDAKAAADNAAVAESMAKLPWAAFGEGTDKGETQAKPEVWKESAKFKEYADKLQTEMSKVVAATKTGKLDNIKAAMGPAGETCKNCHDAYRNR